MRDVLDGLEDAAIYISYHSVSDSIEILSIEPLGRLNQPAEEVIQLHQRYPLFNEGKRSTNIVDYLIQRELKKTA